MQVNGRHIGYAAEAFATVVLPYFAICLLIELSAALAARGIIRVAARRDAAILPTSACAAGHRTRPAT